MHLIHTLDIRIWYTHQVYAPDIYAWYWHQYVANVIAEMHILAQVDTWLNYITYKMRPQFAQEDKCDKKRIFS